MKKFLSVMLMAFCLTIGINFADESKAHAERVWAFSLGNVNYYVETDYSHSWVAVVLNDDRRDGYAHPVEFQFVYTTLDRLACNINYDNGTRDFVLLEESKIAQAVYNVLKNPATVKLIEDRKRAAQNKFNQSVEELNAKNRNSTSDLFDIGKWQGNQKYIVKSSLKGWTDSKGNREIIVTVYSVKERRDNTRTTEFYDYRFKFQNGQWGWIEPAKKLDFASTLGHSEEGKTVLAISQRLYKEKLNQERLDNEKRLREEAERKRIAEEKDRIFNNLIAEGDKFYNAKNYDSAKNSYEKARTENSSKVENFCDALINKGNELKQEKNFAAAVDYYRKAVVMGSINAGDGLYSSLVETGNAARASKNFDDAIKLLNEAINFEPNNSLAYNNIGIVYADMEQYEKAIEYYDKALQILPTYTEVYNNRGNAYKKLKNYDNAIADYKTALSQKLDDKNADVYLWSAYLESKKFNDAVEFYNKRVKNNKNESESWLRLGWSLNELKNYPESIKAIQKSIKLKPTANSYYWLACVYENSNNTKKAVTALKKSLELNPNYEDAKNKLAELSAKK